MEIVEEKDCPKECVAPRFNGLDMTVGLLLQMLNFYTTLVTILIQIQAFAY